MIIVIVKTERTHWYKDYKKQAAAEKNHIKCIYHQFSVDYTKKILHTKRNKCKISNRPIKYK